jgi:tetratricopeptide (TPR) repeat protein
VERVLADFDQVSESGTPRWWSLEGHPGWGKTRIVQEFYRRLAAERQPGERYWPLSLIPDDPVAEGAGVSTVMRKRVYPEQVLRPHEVVPQWFWWGVSCATRSGTPVQALADDLTQFEAHRVGLEERWRRLASPMARLGAQWSSKKGDVAEAAAGETLGVAAGLANLAVPGLGVLVLAAKWGAQGLREGRLAAEASPVVDAAGRGRPDLVDELAPALERLGAAGLPIVIVIEDLHLADESLVELLARLLAARDARVLVISTAWRGLLDEDDRAAHRLLGRVPPDRVHRVLADEVVADLAPSEREVIVRAMLPAVSAGNAGLLAARYANPWALQLACNVRWVRDAEVDLTADEVAELPRDIDDLFKVLWGELPQDTRNVLMVAALSTPTAISDTMGFGDARWDASLLMAVSGTDGWLRARAGDLTAVLGQASDAYAWIRTVDQWLQRFQDPGQHEVAVGRGKVEYGGRGRRSLYAAMARGMSAGVAASPSQELHQARLLVALASEGFLAWDQTTLAGAVTLCASLLALPDVSSRRYVILIVESALRSTTTEAAAAGPLLTLRQQYGSALGESGRAAEAVTAFERLLTDRTRVLGPDAPATLATRNNLASLLGESGRVAEAVTAFERLLTDRTRVLGPDAPATLTTRNNLASLLGESGRVAEAVTAFERLLTDQERVLGPDAPDTLTTRNNLAHWLERRKSN